MALATIDNSITQNKESQAGIHPVIAVDLLKSGICQCRCSRKCLANHSNDSSKK